jgi:GcrA cell cycle regulator
MPQSIRHGYAPTKSGTRVIMTALDPAYPEKTAEALSPKWTSERVAFITEQYLIYRKSGGEIARMLGPAFTRNSVTGKLFRTGALKARSGMGLRSDHGLPRGANFGNPRSGSWKKREDAKPPAPADQLVEARPQAESGGADFVKKTEALFEIDGIALLKTKEGQCRWPARSVDGAAHVCGAPKTRRAYCETHAAIAYRSASPPAPAIEGLDQQTGPARGRSGAPFGEAS